MFQMILEYDEFCMFLLNIEVFNNMTPDFPFSRYKAFKSSTFIMHCMWNV
jgi:hypothetical protein